jgi:hypothetical protein
VIGQSSKPLGVVLPPTVMGNVSNSRKQILLNTLDDELSQYFEVSPPTNVSSGDLPVVSDVFQLQIVEEDGDTQLSVRWMSGNERKIETILCGGCKTIELNGKLEELVVKLFGGKKVVEKSRMGVLYSMGEKWRWFENGDERINDKYFGDIKNRVPNGQGTMTSPEGIKYEGEWKDGKKHGQGTFTSHDGRKYVGEYKQGKRHGQGTLTSHDGEKYVGKWKEGKFHGQGTFTFTDGNKGVGEFRNYRPWNITTYDKYGNYKWKYVKGLRVE